MKLSTVQELLDCNVLCDTYDDPDLCGCQSADMMSDVLAFSEPGTLLITGLVNAQSVRTAAVADVAAILYVRGKVPSDDTVSLARRHNIPVLATPRTMFDVCGLLYRSGMRGVC